MYEKIVTIIEDRQSTLASGLAALLIIVGGFLVFNYFAGQNKIKAPQVTPQSTQSAQVNTNQSQATNVNQPASLGSQSQNLPTTYTVVRGDNLSAIAQKFYGDGNQWTLIASANHLANPSVIHAGNVFTIPVAAAPSGTAQAGGGTTVLGASTTSVQKGSNYTVKSGDTLWDLAISAYGSGYEWYRIDQANAPIPRNINGKPLILPGQILKIP